MKKQISIFLFVIVIIISLIFKVESSEKISLVNPSSSSLVFDTEIHDKKLFQSLKSLNTKIYLSGPLFRNDGNNELIVMNSDLSIFGIRKIEKSFFAGAFEKDGTLKYIGGTCDNKNEPFTNCAEVNHLTNVSDSRQIEIENLNLDFHELELENSGFWLLSYPDVRCESINSNNCKSTFEEQDFETIKDCRVQYIKNGRVTKSWSAAENLKDGESQTSKYRTGGDVFHCNSVESYEIDFKKKLLISMRHTDAIYQVDEKSGKVDWKLGGTNWPEKSLRITNPELLGISSGDYVVEDVLSGQHDARHWGNNLYSVFDNGTLTKRAARGITFKVNTADMSATIIKVFEDPSKNISSCTGSFRNIDNGQYWVAGWGCSYSGLTIFSSNANPIVSSKLSQNSELNAATTDPSNPELRWSLSYRVVPDFN